MRILTQGAGSGCSPYEPPFTMVEGLLILVIWGSIIGTVFAATPFWLLVLWIMEKRSNHVVLRSDLICNHGSYSGS